MFCSCSPIKYWIQSLWVKGKASARGLGQHIPRLIHRRNQAHMSPGGQNITLTLLICSKPLHAAINEQVSNTHMWKQSLKQNLVTPGSAFQHQDLVPINQFDAFIYLLWADCAQRHLKITFTITVFFSFQAIHYLHTFKNTTYLCFCAWRPWEPFPSIICVCVLSRNVIIKCPNYLMYSVSGCLETFYVLLTGSSILLLYIV